LFPMRRLRPRPAFFIFPRCLPRECRNQDRTALATAFFAVLAPKQREIVCRMPWFLNVAAPPESGGGGRRQNFHVPLTPMSVFPGPHPRNASGRFGPPAEMPTVSPRPPLVLYLYETFGELMISGAPRSGPKLKSARFGSPPSKADSMPRNRTKIHSTKCQPFFEWEPRA